MYVFQLFLFEVKYRLRRISTYVYFPIFFTMMLFSATVSNSGPVGTGPATWTDTAEHKYKVALAVTTRKLKADGSGAETEVPLNDLIEVGVFKGTGENQKPPLFGKAANHWQERPFRFDRQ